MSLPIDCANLGRSTLCKHQKIENSEKNAHDDKVASHHLQLLIAIEHGPVEDY
jgi:hypothetical protein